MIIIFLRQKCFYISYNPGKLQENCKLLQLLAQSDLMMYNKALRGYFMKGGSFYEGVYKKILRSLVCTGTCFNNIYR